MSFERFIELLQMLITMTDPENEDELLNAKNILKNLQELAKSSGKADSRTIRSMQIAYHQFTAMLHSKEDFAGVPGEISANKAKRQRLAMMIRPGC